MGVFGLTAGDLTFVEVHVSCFTNENRYHYILKTQILLKMFFFSHFMHTFYSLKDFIKLFNYILHTFMDLLYLFALQ